MMTIQCKQSQEMGTKQQHILACCFDLRGYRQFLSHNEQQLARILQMFVAHIGQGLEAIDGLEQLSLQGDAIIAVYELNTFEKSVSIVNALAKIIDNQEQLQAQLQAESLPTIKFGLGIDCGVVTKTPTYLGAPMGTLYVGKVISTAIRLSDFAERSPEYVAIMTSEAIAKILPIEPVNKITEPLQGYGYTAQSLAI